MNSAPPEIIAEIFSHFVEHNGRMGYASPNHAALTACAVVCSHWRAAAQNALFSTCTFANADKGSEQALSAFELVLERLHDEERVLPRAVRHVCVALGNDNDADTSAFVAVLAMCPAVTRVSVWLAKVRMYAGFAESELAVLRAAALPVRALVLRGGPETECPMLFQFMEVWPHVTSLTSSFGPLPIARSGAVLDCMSLVAFHGVLWDPAHTGAAPALTTLLLSHPGQDFSHLLPHRATLRRLWVALRAQDGFCALAPQLTWLEHLVLNAHVKPDLLSALPPSLVHLGVFSQDIVGAWALTRWLEAGGAPRLQRLSLHCWTYQTDRVSTAMPDYYSELFDVCAKRRIWVERLFEVRQHPQR